MSVEFDGNDYIDFGSIINNQAIRSISAWVYLDDITSKVNYIIYHTGGGWYFGAIENQLAFVQAFSGGTGQWTSSTSLPLTTKVHVGMTYDGDPTHDPTFYLSGSPLALVDDVNTTGTMGDDSDGNLWIGGYSGMTANYGLDGKIQDVRIYNRVLSTGEITTLATESNRGKYVVPSGLVFWTPMTYAASKSTFDGDTLGATDYVVDVIGGTNGVPTGSPVGRGVTDPITSAGADEISFGDGVFHRLWFDDSGIHGTTPVST